MRISGGAAFLPIRLQLTLALVALVSAASAALIYTSYRTMVRSVREEAVSTLEASARTRAATARGFISNEQRQVAAAIKTIYLGCGASGMVNPWCAREDLRRFVRGEHARGARLRYGKSVITAGRLGPESEAPRSGIEFYNSNPDGPSFRLTAREAESGASLEVEYSAEVLANTIADASTRLFTVTPDGIFETGYGAARSRIGEDFIRRCAAGNAETSVERHFAPRRIISGAPLPKASGGCVVASAAEAQVFAPVTRLRDVLSRMAVLFLGGALVVAYILGWVITGPLTRLTRRVAQIRKGDYDTPVPVMGSGEVRQLSEAFAKTTSSIRDTLTALAATERRLSLACKAAKLWLWQHELATGQVVWFAPGAGGSEPQTLSFRALLRKVHPEDRHAMCNALRSARASGEYAAEYRVRSGPNYIWVASWGQMVPRSGGATLGGVSVDSTTRREAELLRIEQQKLLAAAEMASELAHQINNPLSAVTGAVYMACLRAGEDPEMKKFLTIANDEGKRLADIARQLVSLYVPKATMEQVDIRELVDSAIVSCGRQLRTRQDELEAQLAWTGRVLGFKDELRHAILNLLTNALEHSPSSSRIVVRTKRTRFWKQPGVRGIQITVANDGPGIPAEQLGEMLQPFAGTKAQRGTGLGLWVTRSIVAKHGGYLRVRSNARCTVCAVYLPAKAA